VAESKELATINPDDKALVRQYANSIAKSPLDIKRGEGIFLDKHGRPLGRGKFRRYVALYQIGMIGSIVGGAVAAISGAWLAGAALYLGGVSPMLWSKYTGTGKLMAIDLLVRRGELTEAQKRLDASPELRRRNPVRYTRLAGSLANNRGDHETAIRWWREGLPRVKGLARELLKAQIAKALILSGKLEEAGRAADDLSFPAGADEVLTGQSLTKVMLGLYDATRTPTVEELHDWARRALAYSHTGVELAALGWAFERAGEKDMATLLATEAVDRMHYPYLATYWPALQAWLDKHKAPAPSDDSSVSAL
jgi:hypothetical protein